MKRVLSLSLACLWLWTLGACSTGYRSRREASNVIAGRGIETRDQLLTAVNAWLRAHHQPEWTMDELIGRSVDEAYNSTDLWKELEPPVEAFVVSLVKNKRFTHAIQLQTDRRDGIEVGTESGETIRLRTEWKKVIKGQGKFEMVETKQSRFPRRLPLPAHDALSLEILATPAEIRDKDENPKKLGRWTIFLASALTGEKHTAKTAREGYADNSVFVAAPKQLLDVVSADRRKNRQPGLTMDEIVVRVADEISAMKDYGSGISSDLELFLECLVKDKPFVYPMRMSPGGADEIEVFSTKEKLRIPPHDNLSIDILDLPWDASTEKRPLKIDWTSIILSYTFPVRKSKN